ncbi:hypothetical protein EV361DRAFT_922131 [Lentinula raphanica]|nr:hypothetical protein EV361DRAFT_922131 [Lentinula raphanica]
MIVGELSSMSLPVKVMFSTWAPFPPAVMLLSSICYLPSTPPRAKMTILVSSVSSLMLTTLLVLLSPPRVKSVQTLTMLVLPVSSLVPLTLLVPLTPLRAKSI